MTARTQQQRIATNNSPPGALLPGQLYVEMGTPFRLWGGVPANIDATGRKLLVDATNVGPWVPSSGGVMTGLLTLSGAPVNPGHAATKAYTDGLAASTAPGMDGAAAVGVGTTWARSDHIHPTDTSRYAATNPAGYQTAAQVAPAFNGVGRNLVHNPMFNVAQRGTGPFTTVSYTLDRWRMAFVLDTMSISQVQLNDTHRAAIGDEEANNAIAVAVIGNAGTTSFSVLDQYIENVRRLAGKTVTVSFWARAVSGTPKIGVAGGQVFGTGGSPSTGVLINGTATPALSATMTRYSVTLTYPSIAGKTLGTAGDYSRLALFFSSGADNNTFAGGIGVQSSTFVIWGVQLEIGNVATPLEKPDPRYDLSNCQRFYQLGYAEFVSYQVAAGGFRASTSLLTQMRGTTTAVFLGAPTLINLPSVVPTATITSIVFTGTATATGATGFTGSYAASADL